VKAAALAVLAAALVAVPAAGAYKNPTPGRALVLQIPGMHRAKVQRNIAYSGRLKLDVYRPRSARGALPAVLLGGPSGFDKGSPQKMGWAQLIAASGLAAVAFDIRTDHVLTTPDPPTRDVTAAIAYVRRHAARLGIDPSRLCTLGFSFGTAPWHLAATMRDPQPWLRCNVVYYGALDFDDKALAEYSALQLLERAHGHVPAMLVVKAGRDENTEINASIDRFEAGARRLHADVRVVTNAAARHGFDTGPRTARTRSIIRETLRFFQARLAKPLKITESCASAAEKASALRFFTPDDTRLAGVVLGTSTNGVVLAPGSAGALCEWLPYARQLASSGYRVLAYDTHTQLRVDQEMAAAVEALRRSGTERVAVAGSSLGAFAALTGAARLSVQPDVVVSLSSPSSVGPLDGVAAVRKLHVPVLFAAEEEDQPFADDARTLYAAAGSAERRLEIFPGSAHGVGMLQEPAIRAVFIGFLSEHL
jgi:dienelactone hydrolase